MPIRKAAFGVEVVGGFPDWERGQRWIAGGDPSLPLDPSLRDVAALFALVGSGQELPPIGQWAGSEGTFYLRWLPTQRAWDAALVFRPRSYIERSLNLILVMRVEHEEFARGMILAPIIRGISGLRRSISDSATGASDWLSTLIAPADRAADLHDLRMAGAIYAALQRAAVAPLVVSMDDDGFWRGLQLLMQSGVAVEEDIKVAIAFEPEAKLSPESYMATVQVVARDAPRLDSQPLSFRGVSDEFLLGKPELGVTPECIVSEVWMQLRTRADSTFGQLYSPPVRTLPEEQVRGEELREWASHVWSDPNRAKAEFAPLIARASQPPQQRDCLERLAKAMVLGGEANDPKAIVSQVLELARRSRA